MKKDKESGLGVFLEQEDALHPQKPVESMEPLLEADDQGTGLRATLKRMFPLLPTVNARLKFLRVLPGTNYDNVAGADRYLTNVAVVATGCVGILTGAPLLAYFVFLAYKGLDASIYIKALYDKILWQTGTVGLYAYYYERIMEPVSLTIAFLCFVLFLIHVKKGEGTFIKEHPFFRREKDLTFINFVKAFSLQVFCGGMGCLLVMMWNLGYLTLLKDYLFMHDPGPAGVLLYGAIICFLGVVSQFSGALLLYGAGMGAWSIIFRYDRPSKT